MKVDRSEIVAKIKELRMIARELMQESNIPAVYSNFKIVDDYAFLTQNLLEPAEGFCPEDGRKI